MEEKIILTPNGYTCHLKSNITYGEYEDIQNAISEHFVMDSNNKPQVDPKAISVINQKTIDMFLLKIEKDGVQFTGTIRNLPVKDGVFIKTEIDKIFKELQPDAAKPEEEKKGI